MANPPFVDEAKDEVDIEEPEDPEELVPLRLDAQVLKVPDAAVPATCAPRAAEYVDLPVGVLRTGVWFYPGKVERVGPLSVLDDPNYEHEDSSRDHGIAL